MHLLAGRLRDALVEAAGGPDRGTEMLIRRVPRLRPDDGGAGVAALDVVDPALILAVVSCRSNSVLPQLGQLIYSVLEIRVRVACKIPNAIELSILAGLDFCSLA